MKSHPTLNSSRIIESIKGNPNAPVILEGLLKVREILYTNDAEKLDGIIDTGLLADYLRKITA